VLENFRASRRQTQERHRNEISRSESDAIGRPSACIVTGSSSPSLYIARLCAMEDLIDIVGKIVIAWSIRDEAGQLSFDCL